MKIRLYPPFDRLGGEVIEVHLEKEMTLREFSAMLLARVPAFLDLLPPGTKDGPALLHNVFFVTKSDRPARILEPEDTVGNDDFLQILPPFDGG